MSLPNITLPQKAAKTQHSTLDHLSAARSCAAGNTAKGCPANPKDERASWRPRRRPADTVLKSRKYQHSNHVSVDAASNCRAVPRHCRSRPSLSFDSWHGAEAALISKPLQREGRRRRCRQLHTPTYLVLGHFSFPLASRYSWSCLLRSSAKKR